MQHSLLEGEGSMPIKDWKKLSNQILDGSINRKNFTSFPKYDVIMRDIAIKIRKYGYYTFDGRFEDCVIDFLCKKYTTKSDDFNIDNIAKQISLELRKLIVPNIIIVPLNHLNRLYLPAELVLDEDIGVSIV